MASARPPQALRTTSCARCGAYLSVAQGARSVRCGLCHAVTRVEHRPRGLQHAGLVQVFTSTEHLLEPPPASSCYPRVLGCKKRALLVGIRYAGTKYELRGAVNDVNCMSYLLRKRFGFPEDCILVLTEEANDYARVPTRTNLLSALRWLVDGTSAGDSLVFHFSGHGVQKLDMDGDEMIGCEEVLWPVDFEYPHARGGVILDDEINATIVRPLGMGVKLHAIVDTCHSGTILKLPYLCRLSRTGCWRWENRRTSPSASDETKCTSGGLAISIGGCGDSQALKETTVSGTTGYSLLHAPNVFVRAPSMGVMTYSFIKALESEPRTTYGRLLTAMRTTIRDNGGEFGIPAGPISTFFRRVIKFSGAQEPQLCSSETFDIYKKPFLL